MLLFVGCFKFAFTKISGVCLEKFSYFSEKNWSFGNSVFYDPVVIFEKEKRHCGGKPELGKLNDLVMVIFDSKYWRYDQIKSCERNDIYAINLPKILFGRRVLCFFNKHLRISRSENIIEFFLVFSFEQMLKKGCSNNMFLCLYVTSARWVFCCIYVLLIQ